MRRFSATVMRGNTCRPSGHSASPRRTRSSIVMRVMSSPASTTRPPLIGNAPIAAFSRVVLPAPFGPIIAVISPARTVRLALRSARSAP